MNPAHPTAWYRVDSMLGGDHMRIDPATADNHLVVLLTTGRVIGGSISDLARWFETRYDDDEDMLIHADVEIQDVQVVDYTTMTFMRGRVAITVWTSEDKATKVYALVAVAIDPTGRQTRLYGQARWTGSYHDDQDAAHNAADEMLTAWANAQVSR